MRILCGECGRVHEVADDRIPVFGARLRCAGCNAVVELPAREGRGTASAPPVELEPEPPRVNGEGAAPSEPPPRVPVETDRDESARQLARSLIQDIVYADEERFRRARSTGTVLAAFGKELAQAWDFYCDRVGTSFARQSPHFRNAVQDLLESDPNQEDA